ncbi:hypothetical protein [Burkholderia gladioli]|uniref:hypothetical protein n=1 Tax=Burkholderia gladioli TaxID=28095 RepID=UPI0009B84688|nr:hypothetical protein [Burkholderia gladioli]
MDYVLANFIAALAAVVFSVFTSFIASRSGRTIYRKIMWCYLVTLFVASVVTTAMQFSIAILAFGALFSCILAIVAQVAFAVKLGHLVMADTVNSHRWDRCGSTTGPLDDIRNSANPMHYGANDPLRNW